MQMMASDTVQGFWWRFIQVFRSLDSDYFPSGANSVLNQEPKTKRGRWIPLIFMHSVCLGVFFIGASFTAVATAIALYFVRMFAITGFYHRYFSHRTFKTSRAAQFLFAVLGMTAVQRGPLWWAAHHRNHHQFADQPKDSHSPRQQGFLWSHLGWITSDSNIPTDYSKVPDLAKYPELLFLNRFDWVVPVLGGVWIYGLGEALRILAPQLGTNGMQMLVWGFVSTAFLYHGTFSINSLAHVWGTRRFDTDDDSKNNFYLALITMGEGWHNNHHRYPGIVRQGLMWWEIDCTYYLLLLFEKLGIIWDLRTVPPTVPVAVPSAKR